MPLVMNILLNHFIHVVFFPKYLDHVEIIRQMHSTRQMVWTLINNVNVVNAKEKKDVGDYFWIKERNESDT